MKITNQLPSSFRDPSGFLFIHKGTLLRQVNKVYKKHYDSLMNSGLYKSLIEKQLLIPHKEVGKKRPGKTDVYKTIKPHEVPFVSYPYEWCFTQLKDAALVTLEIQKLSLKHGMTLKDASAYNIALFKGKPILIDTLSFEKYQKGQPWVAYRQFCQHFLAPLLLMAKKDVRLSQLLRIYIDGIPLDLASLLLPAKTYFNFSILSHIHLHAKSQKFFEEKMVKFKTQKVNQQSMLGLIENLESTINKLALKPQKTEWEDYYKDTNYSKTAMMHKKRLVGEFLDIAKPQKTVWDIGANTGVFSRLASKKGLYTISFDIDPLAVEKNYLYVKKKSEENILPLLIDLTNPSPGIGWKNKERMSLIERGPADCVMALALIHHLAISNNLPLSKIAEFFSNICTWLIIEFVPKGDSQVKRLLVSREDIFTDYSKDGFEKAFRKHFRTKGSNKIWDSQRTLYLMQKK